MVDLRLSPTGISIREIMGIGGLTISYSKKGLLHFAWVGFVRGAGLRTFPFLQARNLCLQYRNHKAVILPLWFRGCRHRILCLQKRKSAVRLPARNHAGMATGPGLRPWHVPACFLASGLPFIIVSQPTGVRMAARFGPLMTGCRGSRLADGRRLRKGRR